MRKIIIVEDDELFLIQVRIMLEECYGENLSLTTFRNAKEVDEKIANVTGDLVLMDLILESEQAGVTLAKRFREMSIPVIFMTSFRQQGLFQNALSASPANYLQKPFTAIELQRAIELALVGHQQIQKASRDQLNLGTILLTNSNGALEKIEIADIIAIESYGNYCHFYRIGADRLTHRMSLKRYTDLVPTEHFIQIHRRFVVNKNLIDRVDQKERVVWAKGLNFAYGQKYRDILFSYFSS